MLSDQVTQLLTAFVDGELSQRQRKVVARLLHKSSEARELLRQLQENAHRIKKLPRRKVKPSLVNDVLQAIAERHMEPSRPAPAKRPLRWVRPFVAVTMAASLLAGAIGLLYWQAMSNHEGNDTPLVKNTPPPITKKQQPPPKPDVPPQAKTPPPKLENPLIPKGEEPPQKVEPIPEAPAFTATFKQIKNQGMAASRLEDRLKRDKVVQLDITVKNNSIAMERLKAALHDQRITVIVDADAQKALKKNSKVEYLVYAENLTTDEISNLLKDLAKNDTKGKKNEPTPYEKVKVATMGAKEKAKVSSTLGIDFAKTENEKKNNDWERTAVVMPVSAQPSADVRRFAAQKHRPQAGAVQILIKIHQE